jgi:hypothetical protein
MQRKEFYLEYLKLRGQFGDVIVEDNIKIDVKEIGLYGVDWAQTVQERILWRVLVTMIFFTTGNFLTI